MTINKATPTLTLTGSTAVYHNTAYITGKASVAGKIYWGTSTSSMPNAVSVSANTDTTLTSRVESEGVGTTTIYAYFVPTDTTNYNSVGSSSSYAASASAKVTAATDNDITVTVTSSITYNPSSAQTIATKTGGHGCAHFTLGYSTTSGGTVTWGTQDATTLTVPAGASVGTYYIHYKVTPDSNHSTTINDKQLTATTTIAKANGSGSVTMSG